LLHVVYKPSASKTRSTAPGNRDEEKEHAAMTLEWLRRHDPKLDEVLRTYLFSEGSILAAETKAAEGGGEGAAAATGGAGSLGIGSLRGRGDQGETP
jgi:hypothetical protein